MYGPPTALSRRNRELNGLDERHCMRFDDRLMGGNTRFRDLGRWAKEGFVGPCYTMVVALWKLSVGVKEENGVFQLSFILNRSPFIVIYWFSFLACHLFTGFPYRSCGAFSIGGGRYRAFSLSRG